MSNCIGAVVGGKLSEEGGETAIRVEHLVVAIIYFGLALGLTLGYLPGLRMSYGHDRADFHTTDS
ncbi:MAG: hypothetical protein C4288_04320 [Leptolyngbya sp. ERB_1_1]